MYKHMYHVNPLMKYSRFSYYFLKSKLYGIKMQLFLYKPFPIQILIFDHLERVLNKGVNQINGSIFFYWVFIEFYKNVNLIFFINQKNPINRYLNFDLREELIKWDKIFIPSFHLSFFIKIFKEKYNSLYQSELQKYSFLTNRFLGHTDNFRCRENLSTMFTELYFDMVTPCKFHV